MINSILMEVKESALSGIKEGYLSIVGSVVRYNSGPHKGAIHSHLQPTNAPERSLNQFFADISGMQWMSSLNLLLSAADIGISIVGFLVMNRKLNTIKEKIDELSEEIKSIKNDIIERDFIKLQSFIEIYENTWRLKDYEFINEDLINIVNSANEIQILFERHAINLLSGGVCMLDAADRMLDAMALTIGLRVSAAVAANQSDLAQSIADQGAKKIDSITGPIGLIDLLRAKMPFGIDAKSLEWEDVFLKTKEEVNPLIVKQRLREINAVTRSSIFTSLMNQGIAPREWLSIARFEHCEPFLFLPHK